MHQVKGKKGYMTIKIDVEKAYDQLDQNFVVESLKDVGLTNHFVNLIWHCIFSAFVNILWNGESTSEFFPSRGIKQCDPISPYLFVICIERISHLIQLVVNHNHWKPITLSRCGPPIMHLCFADDLVIFAEAFMSQVEIISKCVKSFCVCSNKKFSKEKIRIFFFPQRMCASN